MTRFDGVVPALNQALEKRGYSELTPVQLAVLEPQLADADLLVSAQTGSGKTVAFGMALAPTLLVGADRFSRGGKPLALVVAPTRELALQVKRELEWLYAGTGAAFASCVGGMDMRTERQNLGRGAQIVVGTPGRLRDHIQRGSFDTTMLRAVVLDEADEMLDLGFRDDLEYILEAAPKDRRTLMFSATVPRTIANLAKRYQRDAVRLQTTAEKEQHLDIDYRAMTVAPNDRENAVVNVLRYYEAKNALVFCGTRAAVNHMTSRFTNRGFSVVALSGELSQSERTQALQKMRDGRARVCIATDVAARGIDLPNLELVVHADLPKKSETLLHRSGRTGRAGRKGVCALIVPHSWRRRTERLLQNANVKATWAAPPSVEEIIKRDQTRIMDDPVLSDPLREDEQAFAAELLARHGAEQIAAAFLRSRRESQTAPEELLNTAPPPERDRERDRKQRSDFKGGAWVSLSVGREHNAEPRWLLPMLCRAGKITKRDIGAIKIFQTETHVELTANSIDSFLEAIGPSRKVDKTISIERIKGRPSNTQEGAGDYKPRPPSKFKRKSRPQAAPVAAAGADEVVEAVDNRSDKPREESDGKAKRKFKAKSPKKAKTNAKSRSGTKPGSRPLKRKKPKK